MAINNINYWYISGSFYHLISNQIYSILLGMAGFSGICESPHIINCDATKIDYEFSSIEGYIKGSQYIIGWIMTIGSSF